MSKWLMKNLRIDIDKIAQENKISKILAIILANRGIETKTEIQSFLNPDIQDMYKPEIMKDMIIAGDIIEDCIKFGKKIRIVGDYDVDGITSVYILYKILSQLDAKVDYVIPDRVQDGYGINNFLILEAKAQGIDTIITVDNGISAFDQVKLAKDMDMRFILTDHHDIPEKLPEADAIVNPKQSDCNYPNKLLCGAGVAYKLALHMTARLKVKTDMDEMLAMAALATICDVVDLVGENRIIAIYGLYQLNRTTNKGLTALIEASGLSEKKLEAYHAGFILGPTLNASGRLDSALIGLELLLSDDEVSAERIALKLRELNTERQELTRMGVENIEKQIEEKLSKNDVIVAFDPEIHESVAGIVAGKIKEKYNKPTIVLTNGKNGIKGSGRSIEGYHLYKELAKCENLLEKFGGHPMAAGLSLKEENINKLRQLLNANINMSEEDMEPKIYIEAPLDPANADAFFIKDLERLEPFGKGNPRPLFGYKGLSVLKASVLGKNSNVLKLILRNNRGEQYDGISFSDPQMWIAEARQNYGEAELNRALSGISNSLTIDIVYYPSINEYKGRQSIQLVISDYRFLS